MRLFARHRAEMPSRAPSHRLLWASLLLALLLLLTFGAALFLFISLHNTKKDTVRSLKIQYAVFQNDMERYFDQLAVMGINLSEDMSDLVEQQLAAQGMTSFRQLSDAPEALTTLPEPSSPAPGCMCRKAGPTPPPCPCCCTAAAQRWASATA